MAPAPPPHYTAYATLHFQNTPFVGEVAFCPLAQLDDGLMDIVGVLASSRLRLAGTMRAATAGGSHVLRRGCPLGTIVSCQASEVVLRPLPRDPCSRRGRRGKTLIPGTLHPRSGMGALPLGSSARPMLQQWEGGPLPVVRRESASVRSEPFAGERVLTIDGELNGPAPARLRVIPGAMRLLA